MKKIILCIMSITICMAMLVGCGNDSIIVASNIMSQTKSVNDVVAEKTQTVTVTEVPKQSKTLKTKEVLEEASLVS